jgi:L-alanine-DL-glutamate epimerase-like enolase superfamily enzyme
MMTIASVGVDHYRIPLPMVLSDSTHGDIAEFELVTVRVRDAAGTEGLGYTSVTTVNTPPAVSTL